MQMEWTSSELLKLFSWPWLWIVIHQLDPSLYPRQFLLRRRPWGPLNEQIKTNTQKRAGFEPPPGGTLHRNVHTWPSSSLNFKYASWPLGKSSIQFSDSSSLLSTSILLSFFVKFFSVAYFEEVEEQLMRQLALCKRIYIVPQSTKLWKGSKR